MAFPTTPGQFVFLLGLFITIVLWVLKIRAALIISILVTTIDRPRGRGLDHPVAAHGDAELLDPRPGPSGSVPGLLEARLSLAAILTIFAIMLTRLLRHDGHGHRHRGRGRPRPSRRLGARHRPGPHRRLDRRHRRRGRRRLARTRPTSRARPASPRAAGPGFASIVTGVLFLARDLPVAARSDHPDPGDGTGPRPRRLPDVHPGQGHQRGQRRGRHPGAADDHPHAPHLRHHGRHRRRASSPGCSSSSSAASSPRSTR